MDSGGEYTSMAFSSYLAENGIKHELTNPYTPQENGMSECMNQTLNNLTCLMIANAKEVLHRGKGFHEKILSLNGPQL